MQVCIERKKMCKRNYWLKIPKVKMKVVPYHKRKSYGKSFFEIFSGSKVREQNPLFVQFEMTILCSYIIY